MMTRRPTEFDHGIGTAELAEKETANSDKLQATLREQICRRLPRGARRLAIDLNHAPPTVILRGAIGSFYAKQLLYQICRRCIPDYRVIDMTVVGERPKKQTR